MEPMKKKYHYQADLKQDLLAKGIEIICEKGVSALTLKSLAGALGVTSAAMYHHYPDKTSLMVAIVSKRLQELNTLLEEKAYQPFTDDVTQMFVKAAMLIYDFCEEHHEFLIILNGDAISNWDNYPLLQQGIANMWKTPLIAVQKAQGEGLLRAGDSEALLLMAFSSIHGYLSLVFSGKGVLPVRIIENSRRDYFDVACGAVSTIKANLENWQQDIKVFEKAVMS